MATGTGEDCIAGIVCYYAPPMKNQFSKYIVVTFCAAILVPGLLFAAKKNDDTTERVRYDKVTSVNADEKKITIYDHIAKDDIEYTINAFTHITLNGKAGT